MSARILLLALLAGWTWAADRLVTVPGTGLQLAIPADWTADPGTGAALAFHQRGGSGGIAASVVQVGPETGPAAFARARLAELDDLGAGVDILEHRFAFPVGTRTWSRIRYRLRIGPVAWEQALWATVEDGRGICITGSAEPSSFPRLLPVFERAVAAAGASRAVLAP